MLAALQGGKRKRLQVAEARSTAATMLGLPGVVVLAVDQIDDEIQTTVETTAHQGVVSGV